MIIELNGHRYREEERGHFEAALVDGGIEIAHTCGNEVIMISGNPEDVELWAESFGYPVKVLRHNGRDAYIY